MFSKRHIMVYTFILTIVITFSYYLNQTKIFDFVVLPIGVLVILVSVDMLRKKFEFFPLVTLVGGSIMVLAHSLKVAFGLCF